MLNLTVVAPDSAGTGSDTFLPVFRTIIEVDSSTGTSYGNSFQRIPNAYCETLAYTIGPSPAEATFIIPVAKANAEPGGIFDHKVHEIATGATRLGFIEPITMSGGSIRLFS